MIKEGPNSQGWKQFLIYRKEILDAYDQAREKAKISKVQTQHGNVIEGKFREWLSEFLPKRYEVTSGYVISQGLGSDQKAPHYDVIIYDALNSPVLWKENNPDSSSSGKSKAIPAEHVLSVIEVKSSFDSTTVEKAIQHLKELKPLMTGFDPPEERYKKYLPKNFFCAVVFCELRDENKNSETALYKMSEGIKLRNFFGGLVLRAESHTEPVSGNFKFVVGENSALEESNLATSDRTLLNNSWSNPREIESNKYLNVMLTWAESNFAQFAFDMIALMEGTYEVGRLSSMHGFGISGYEND